MKREEWHLQRFVNICPEVPSGLLIYKDCPDLRIQTEDKTIGIEHTQFINQEDMNLKATEEVEKRILKKAQSIFEKSYDKPIYVYTYFRPQIILTKYDTDEIAESLSSLVIDHLPNKGEYKHISCWHGQYKSLDKIDFVDIHWFEKATYPLWAVPMSGVVPKISPTIINNRIIIKEQRITDYLLSCDDIWLLLVIDGHSPSSSWDIPKNVLEYKYVTDFHKIYLFENFSSKYYKLKTS